MKHVVFAWMILKKETSCEFCHVTMVIIQSALIHGFSSINESAPNAENECLIEELVSMILMILITNARRFWALQDQVLLPGEHFLISHKPVHPVPGTYSLSIIYSPLFCIFTKRANKIF